MAYMNQDKKKIINTALKIALKDYPSVKYTLAVEHHSTLVITIKAGPQCLDVDKKGHKQVSLHHITKHYNDEAATILKLCKGASDSINHDNSDTMTDYFDVGHYLSIEIGSYNKPFVSI